MKHLKTFNENISTETPIGNVDGFDLIYQTFSKMMGGDGVNGTIRTSPENYYVATIDSDGDIRFDDLEVNTRNINKDKVIALYHDFLLKTESISYMINEDGDGGAAGSGDGGGVAYATQGSVSGMGAVSNATVSPVPGDPSFSEPGSGDRSFGLGTTKKKRKKEEEESLTGTIYQKMSSDNKKFLQDAKKVKDKLGIGKVKSFQDFLNN